MTLTKLIDQRIEILAPSDANLESLVGIAAQGVFVPSVATFVEKLAGAILADSDSRQYPGVIAFALWCRNPEVNELSSPNLHCLLVTRLQHTNDISCYRPTNSDGSQIVQV